VSATLRFDNIGKVFPGVRALDGVSFDVNVGQVHGLMGENGAGKSTLLKILGGEYQPDSGRVMIDGKEVRFTSAASSIAAGIAVIHQELQYVPDLTVAENLLLGQLPNSFGWVKKRDAKRFVRERLEEWASRSIRTRSCASSPSRNDRWWKSARRCCATRA